jgi:hypothetical protein
VGQHGMADGAAIGRRQCGIGDGGNNTYGIVGQ